MKSIYITIITAMSVLLLMACNAKEFGDPKASTPVIESLSIHPTEFNFSDTVTLKASVRDLATMLTTLEYEVVSNNKIILTGTIPLSGSDDQVDEKIQIPLLSGQPDSASVTINVTLKNVLHGQVSQTINNLTGKRKSYPQLFLVSNLGNIVTLTPSPNNKDQYEATGLTLPNTFNYRIAERLTSDNQVDPSGGIWANVGGYLSMADVYANEAFGSVPTSLYTRSVIFNYVTFDIYFVGDNTAPANTIALSAFTDKEVNKEEGYEYTLQLDQNTEYTIVGDLASNKVVWNVDFFERISAEKVKFLGESGNYTLYYNAYRQFVLITPTSASYPNYLVVAGDKIGYPSKVAGIDKGHSGWGFGNPLQFVLFRQISSNIFRGTIYIGEKASFKPFENTGWANDKQLGTFTTITGEQILTGDGNWDAKNTVDANAFYQITIDLNTMSIDIVKVTKL